jgi:hypothetical protein
MQIHARQFASALIHMREPDHAVASFPTIEIKSWQEFLKAVSQLAHCAFRGECDQNSQLLASLPRYFRNFNINRKVWSAQESRILRIFKRKANNYSIDATAIKDDFEWMALMEHHGAPTRLLDFTWSPYVAAFFALEQATHDAIVWALDPGEIMKMQGQVADKLNLSSLTEADPRLSANLEKYFIHGEVPFVWVGEPHNMNRRLLAQSGTFVVPSVLDESIEDILLKNTQGTSNALFRLVLATREIREEGMSELYRMNITHASLFPDLIGLAKSLAYELEFHWAYDPHTGERV